MRKMALFLFLLLGLQTEAATRKIDGINYDLKVQTLEAEVISADDNYQGDIVIPDSLVYADRTFRVTSIGSFAFQNAVLKSLSLPSGLKVIGEKAFMRSKGLREIALPDGLKEIGYQAFSGCSDLKILHIPDSLETIGGSAFYGCTVDTVYVNTLEHFCSIERVREPMPNTSHLVINGKEVTDLTIPATIAAIKPWTFQGCPYLQTVTIEDGVTKIGVYAFQHCVGIKKFDIPNSVTQIDEGAFLGCSSLEEIVLPDGLTTIAKYLFGNCKNLKPLKFPSHLTTIGDYAFQNCAALTSLELPEGLTSIGREAFYRCVNLTSLELPEGLSSIGISAFEECKALTSIKLPASISKIDYWAFARIGENLKTCYCLATQAPKINATAFNDTDIDFATLYVPASAIEDYLFTDPWSTFGEIKAMATGIDAALQSKPQADAYFDLQGKRLQQPQKGITIIRTADGKARKYTTK